MLHTSCMTRAGVAALLVPPMPGMLVRLMPPRPKPPRRPGCCAGGRGSVGLVVRHCGHLTSLAPGGTPNFVLHRKQSIVVGPSGVVPSGRVGSCAAAVGSELRRDAMS